MVAPSTYTVRLTVDGQTMEESFALQLDPNVAASGVTLADVQQQEAVALEIVELLSEVKRMTEAVKTEQRPWRRAISSLPPSRPSSPS
jgi:hypothetical protein